MTDVPAAMNLIFCDKHNTYRSNDSDIPCWQCSEEANRNVPHKCAHDNYSSPINYCPCYDDCYCKNTICKSANKYIDITNQPQFTSYSEKKIKELESLVEAQAKDLYNIWNRDSKCNHYTLRTSFLPCPHPECYGEQAKTFGDQITVLHARKLHLQWGDISVRVDHESNWKSTWRRLMSFDKVPIYSWEPISGYPIPKEYE